MNEKYSGLNKEGLPLEPGIYSVKTPTGDELNIEVYLDESGKLCFHGEDFWSGGPRIDEEHIHVENTGLEFIAKIGVLD